MKSWWWTLSVLGPKATSLPQELEVGAPLKILHSYNIFQRTISIIYIWAILCGVWIYKTSLLVLCVYKAKLFHVFSSYLPTALWAVTLVLKGFQGQCHHENGPQTQLWVNTFVKVNPWLLLLFQSWLLKLITLSYFGLPCSRGMASHWTFSHPCDL
jgi:hypothetical protein